MLYFSAWWVCIIFCEKWQGEKISSNLIPASTNKWKTCNAELALFFKNHILTNCSCMFPPDVYKEPQLQTGQLAVSVANVHWNQAHQLSTRNVDVNSLFWSRAEVFFLQGSRRVLNGYISNPI